MARPTKFNETTAQRILDALRLGAPLARAANAAGVSDETLARWRKTKPDFARAVEEALAESVLACLRRIQEAADAGHWQAAAWLLERRYPEEWGRRTVEPKRPDQIRVVVEYENKEADSGD